jgi:superkiller protein 3
MYVSILLGQNNEWITVKTARIWMVVLTLALSAAPATVRAQSLEQLVQQGNAAQAAKKWAESEAIWRKVIQIDTKNAPAYSNLCDALARQNKLDEALSLCRRAIDLDPRSAPAYKNLGNVLYFQKKLEEAIAAYRTAIKLDPNSAIAYNGLGNALSDQKKLEQAIAAYRTAIKLDPNNSLIYPNLGNALSDQGKIDEAVNAYRKALTLPNMEGTLTTAHAHAHNGLGLLQQQKKLEEAIREFEQAVKLDPNYSFARNNLEEAKRKLALQRNPRKLALAETRYLSQDGETPLRRAVVKVVAFFPGNNRGTGIGTGCIIKNRNGVAWVLTNRHVVFDPDNRQKGENLQIELYFGNVPRELNRPRLGEDGLGSVRILHMTDPDDPLDLAVLEVTGLPDIPPLPLASGGIQAPSLTKIIDNPGGGWQSNEAKLIDADTEILTLKIKLDSGSSGSPVLVNNQMVGLVRSSIAIQGTENPQGTSYAYPMSRILQKLNEWGIRLP